MTTALLLGTSGSWLSQRCTHALNVYGVTTVRDDYDDAIWPGPEPLDFIFCCDYPHRVREPLLSLPRRGAINLHPAVLPHNRGRHSAFWGIMNQTPLGATIHWMDATFDTGPIIGQEIFHDDGLMTAQEVYDRQMRLCGDLFDRWLPRILDGTAPRIPQVGGDYHKAEDIKGATEFVVSNMPKPSYADPLGPDEMNVEYLLRLIRATSHGDHGFYVTVGGVRYKVQGRVTRA